MRPTQTPEVRRAVRLLMRVVPDSQTKHSDPVGYWDAVTSGNDARAALSIARGTPLDRIDPVLGTGPTA